MVFAYSKHLFEAIELENIVSDNLLLYFQGEQCGTPWAVLAGAQGQCGPAFCLFGKASKSRQHQGLLADPQFS